MFRGTGPPPPPTSPVTGTFSCTHTEGTFRAVATNVSEKRPFGDYKVSLLEVPSNAKLVTKAIVHKFYLGGNSNVSLFFDDNDDDGNLSVGDDFWVGSFRTGPYDVTIYWASNDAVVTTVRCT